jgi:ketosteroid isomerase-like protein
MVARGRLGGLTAAAGLATTGGALAIDLAALREERGHEELLAAAYEAFNRRDLDAALGLMHPDVEWPNAWEGGRVRGRVEVRAYWERQFGEVSSRVEPIGYTVEADGSVTVDVHQVVRDPRSGDLIGESRVSHRYWLDDGLIVRMDVVEPGDGAS